MAVAAVVAAGFGAYKLIKGGIDKSKAKKQAAQNEATRPKYSESPYYKEQLALAGSELSNGMGAAGDVYKQESDQDLSSSLDAITKMGGTPNDVASVFSANQQGRARLALMKSNLRLNQISNLSKAQEAEEEDRERAFGYNVTAPFKDKAAATALSLQSAEGEISGGIDTVGNALTSYAGAKSGQNQFNNYFKTLQTDNNSQDIVRRANPNTNTVATNDTFIDPANDPNFQYINPR